MKKIVLLIALLATAAMLAAPPPPILRQFATTNEAPILTNIIKQIAGTVTNASSGTVDVADFTVVQFGDIQNAAKTAQGHTYFSNSVTWLIAQKTNLNIKAVCMPGDITDDSANETYWAFATNQLQRLATAGIPVFASAGNHDQNGTHSPWNAHMGSFIAAQTGYADSLAAGDYYGAAWAQTNSGVKMVFIAMGYATNATDFTDLTTFGRTVSGNYRDHVAVFITHAYLSADGIPLNVGDEHYAVGINGIDLWTECFSLAHNAGQILCGHDWPGEYARYTQYSEFGNRVDSLLFNEQDAADGGGNFVRLYRWKPMQGTVEARTYNTASSAYIINSNATFVLPVYQSWAKIAGNSIAGTRTTGYVPKLQADLISVQWEPDDTADPGAGVDAATVTNIINNTAIPYTDAATNALGDAAYQGTNDFRVHRLGPNANEGLAIGVGNGSSNTWIFEHNGGEWLHLRFEEGSFDSHFWDPDSQLEWLRFAQHPNNAIEFLDRNIRMFYPNGLDFRDQVAITFDGTVAVLGTNSYYGRQDGLTNDLGQTIPQQIANATNGLASTNWVIQQIANIGLHLYSSGITNTGSLAGKTNNWQALSSPSSTVSTNSITGVSANDYIRNTVSTQTFYRIETGPISVKTYIFRSGTAGGTVSMHPEIYLYDTASNTLPVELVASPAQAITSDVPTLYDFSVSANSVTWTNPFKVVLSWKMDSTPLPGTVINFVSGGSYDSHLSFVQNMADASINFSQLTSGTATGKTFYVGQGAILDVDNNGQIHATHIYSDASLGTTQVENALSDSVKYQTNSLGPLAFSDTNSQLSAYVWLLSGGMTIKGTNNFTDQYQNAYGVVLSNGVVVAAEYYGLFDDGFTNSAGQTVQQMLIAPTNDLYGTLNPRLAHAVALAASTGMTITTNLSNGTNLYTLSSTGSGVSVAAGTNGIAAETNGSVVTIHYTGAGASLANATNNDIKIAGELTNHVQLATNNLLTGIRAADNYWSGSNYWANARFGVFFSETNQVPFADAIVYSDSTSNLVAATSAQVRTGLGVSGTANGTNVLHGDWSFGPTRTNDIDSTFFAWVNSKGSGTGSSNITDNAYVAEVRNLTVKTNATFEGGATFQGGGTNTFGGFTRIVTNQVAEIELTNGVTIGGVRRTTWPDGGTPTEDSITNTPVKPVWWSITGNSGGVSSGGKIANATGSGNVFSNMTSRGTLTLNNEVGTFDPVDLTVVDGGSGEGVLNIAGASAKPLHVVGSYSFSGNAIGAHNTIYYGLITSLTNASGQAPGTAAFAATGDFLAAGGTAVAAASGDTATAFFPSGTIERERGGLAADTSGYFAGVFGSDAIGNTIDIDTEAELETALGGTDFVTVTTDDISSANLRTILSDETGSGAAVFVGGAIGAATGTGNVWSNMTSRGTLTLNNEVGTFDPVDLTVVDGGSGEGVLNIAGASAKPLHVVGSYSFTGNAIGAHDTAYYGRATQMTNDSGTAVVFVGGAIGAATATTPTTGDSDTSVATTAFVQGEIDKPSSFATLTDGQSIRKATGTDTWEAYTPGGGSLSGTMAGDINGNSIYAITLLDAFGITNNAAAGNGIWSENRTNWVVSGEIRASGGTSNYLGGTTFIAAVTNAFLATNNITGTPTTGYAPVIQANGAINWAQVAAASTVTNSKSLTFAAPTATENVSLWDPMHPIVLDKVTGHTQGGGSITFNIAFHASRNSASSNLVFSSNQTINSATTQTFTISDTTVEAGSVWFVTTATSGTVTDANITIHYH